MPINPQHIEALRTDESVRDAFVDCYTAFAQLAGKDEPISSSDIVAADKAESILIQAILTADCYVR